MSKVNIVLIGGSVEAMVMAHSLIDEHNVFLIELEAEFGLPALHPGRIVDPNLLTSYLTDEQQSFLSLQSNEDGFGCRWDWLLKHLAANIARQGVVCLSRTRIVSCVQQGDQYSIELSPTERDVPTHLIADRVIVMTPPHRSGPGQRTHHLHPDTPESFPYPEVTEWCGGTVITRDMNEAPNPTFTLTRGDGMTELWWPTPTSWMPPQGFIESVNTLLPSDKDELSFDAVVHRVHHYLSNFV